MEKINLTEKTFKKAAQTGIITASTVVVYETIKAVVNTVKEIVISKKQ